MYRFPSSLINQNTLRKEECYAVFYSIKDNTENLNRKNTPNINVLTSLKWKAYFVCKQLLVR